MFKRSNKKVSEDALDKYIEEASSEDLSPEKRYATFYNIITKATIAEMQGELMASVYLYMAAYEIAKDMDEQTLANALLGLENAWKSAIGLKNRPVVEQIFDILAHHLNEDALKPYSDDLHNLMVSKLEDLGFPIDNITKDLDLDKLVNDAKPLPQKSKKAPDGIYVQNQMPKYKNLIGYDKAITEMKELGFGEDSKAEYKQLVQRLNKEHGLDRVAFSETILFRSPSRIDSKIFMEATAGEIGLPVIHMRMDDSVSGASVLTLLAPVNSNFKLNPTRTGFNGKGIIILEDVDTWVFPEVEINNSDTGIEAMMAAQMNRGIAEVLNLLDVAVEDPNILVMASVGKDAEGDKFVKNLFDKYRIIDLDYPNEAERFSIWTMLANDHPSLRAFNLNKLVNYSKNMSRYSIEVAAHEALEDAYKEGLEKREYVPLSILKIIEKLAEHQPLESNEYKNLEDAATASFSKTLENIDDLLK